MRDRRRKLSAKERERLLSLLPEELRFEWIASERPPSAPLTHEQCVAILLAVPGSRARNSRKLRPELEGELDAWGTAEFCDAATLYAMGRHLAREVPSDEEKWLRQGVVAAKKLLRWLESPGNRNRLAGYLDALALEERALEDPSGDTAPARQASSSSDDVLLLGALLPRVLAALEYGRDAWAERKEPSKNRRRGDEAKKFTILSLAEIYHRLFGRKFMVSDGRSHGFLFIEAFFAQLNEQVTPNFVYDTWHRRSRSISLNPESSEVL